MKNELYKELYEEYRKGFSLSEVGRMFGMTRQSVYAGFKCRGWELRAKKLLPFLMFDNKKFTLRNVGYYGMTYGERELMHRYVWRFYNGEIKEGYDVHHRDRDRTNNRIGNLEVISKSEHSKLYNSGHNQYTYPKHKR